MKKRIPEEYKYGSIQQRLDLLRGLMDTDGYSVNMQTYYTTSEGLKNDVVDLVRSLGGIPTWGVKKGKYKKDGVVIECKDCYSVYFSLKPYNPFYLKRKAKKWISNPRDNGRWIEKIEYESKQRTVCISVDSPDHSYVTDNYTVTHNTICELAWSEHVVKHTGKDVLIIAPLSVVEQTRREAEKFGTMPVNVCRTQADVKPGINITNYDMAEHFDHKHFVGVVLDESSCLKGYSSQTTKNMTEWFADTPYKLICTATIAPNAYTEIATSCEFLGIMKRYEMLATYFIHDSGTDKGNKWRLKHSGAKRFWEFMATWAVCFLNPKELDYDIEGYDLPELKIHTVIVDSDLKEGELVVIPASTLEERRLARKLSIEARSNKALEIMMGSNEQFLIWVDYNDESSVLHKKITGSVEIKGSDSPEIKANASLDFASGNIKRLISKPAIFGFGCNFQNCHNIIFCGLSDSEERFYQAIRRCWRFGQKETVHVYIIISEREMNILKNINRKEEQIHRMQEEMTALMKDTILSEIKNTQRQTTDYMPEERMILPEWI